MVKMASIVFQSFANYNNSLCDTGLKGWVTLTTFPLVFGGLNIIIWICILITAIVIRYQTPNWQNTDDQGNTTFIRSFGFAILWWYVALLGIGLIYKLFFCAGTVGVSKAYAELGAVKGSNVSMAKNLAQKFTQ